MKGAWLEDLSWPDVREWFESDAVVIIPIGAFAKEHGPHLPFKTDSVLARALAEKVALELPVLIAPVIGFGYYPAFTEYPGSQNLEADTFIALFEDLVGNLIDHGVEKIAVINTGVSTEAPLAISARTIFEETGVLIAMAHMRTLGRDSDDLLEQKTGGHADERETSLMLAVAPDLVRMDRAEVDYGNELTALRTAFQQPATFRNEPEAGLGYSKTGVCGDPTLATKEKGEAILQAMTRDLVEGIRVLFADEKK
ncbi:MAG: creatininase family protein [Rhodospirillales bacterium]|nr:creatininase family protein [Rhodospirillales bacterium]